MAMPAGRAAGLAGVTTALGSAPTVRSARRQERAARLPHTLNAVPSRSGCAAAARRVPGRSGIRRILGRGQTRDARPSGFQDRSLNQSELRRHCRSVGLGHVFDMRADPVERGATMAMDESRAERR